MDILRKGSKSHMAVLYILISLFGITQGFIIGMLRAKETLPAIRIACYLAVFILTLIMAGTVCRKMSHLYNAGIINTSGICCFIIFTGFIIRFLYIAYSTIYMRQNDVLTLEESGHLGYIAYVYVFFKPPTPGTGWEFTQPPLWYYLCAVWLKAGMKLTQNFDLLLESLQVLSMAFSTGIMIVCDRIALELKLSDKARITACLFGAFYPYMIFMSGAINNDCLATFLSMLTILYAIRWISSYRFTHLILTALFFGLSLFAKFSSIVLGPALAAIIIITFVKKEKTLRSVIQYVVFAVISSVIGLSWPVYSRIFHGIPIGYINYASEAHRGDHAVWELLFSFKNQLSHYYLNVVEGDRDYDFNIFSTIIKSGTFGVDNFMSDNGVLKFIGITLMWINIALALYLVITSIIWAVRSGRAIELRVFVSLVIWVSVVLLYGRAIYSAYTCNMELRFMLPAFLMMVITGGAEIPGQEDKNVTTETRTKKIYGYTVLAMSILSISMWLIVLTIRDYESIRIVLG